VTIVHVATKTFSTTKIFELFPDVESVVTAVFTDESGRTRLTADVAYPSLEVRDAVLHSGMPRGAAISYDRLEELVARLEPQSRAIA
jgi:uncharacterized protein YndB with AHSA1/START domain